MPTGRADVLHLYRRAGFGLSFAEADALTNLDLADLVEGVLDVTASPPPVPPPFAYPPTTSDLGRLRNWWFERMRTNPAPLAEKVVLFWHGVLPTRLALVQPALDYQIIDTFRRLGFGPYGDLLREVSLTPAMMKYLSVASSSRLNPNRNFAREALELFSIGVGNYRESDVDEMARAWTGYRIEGIGNDLVGTFDATKHDDGPKTIFGVTRAYNGVEALDRVSTEPDLRRLTAITIARRAWTFFAYPRPSKQVVTDVATPFDASGLDSTVLLRSIFSHPSFWAPEKRTGLLRTPVDWAVSALRATGIAATAVDPSGAALHLANMGMRPFDPPHVGGWATNVWTTPSAFIAKTAFVSDLVTAMATQGVLTETRSMSPADAADATISRFALDRATPSTRDALVGFLTQHRAETKDPTFLNSDLRGLVTICLLSPEYQYA